jgi:Zn-dependent protease/CBS domain-containing protein
MTSDKARMAAPELQSATRPGFRLGRIAGVEVRLDGSLIVVFLLVAVNLGGWFFPAQHPNWSASWRWATAIAAALLFFASVLAHELAHALVGRWQGVPVERITLFVLGGMAELRSEPKTPKAELLMAAVGPLTSLVIGLLATWLGWLAIDPGTAQLVGRTLFVSKLGPAATLLLWLGPVNVVLAIFNLLPGFPLDGGRVLRAILWRATGDLERATRWATEVGRALAWTLMLIGVLMMFGRRVPLFGAGTLQGIWLVFIGWFLNGAAVRSYQTLVLRRLFEDLPVASLMRRATPGDAIARGASLQAAADRFQALPAERCLPVAQGADITGLICVSDLKKTPREEWPRHQVAEVMTPIAAIPAARPSEEVVNVLGKLGQDEVDQVPVIEDGRVLGFLNRTDVIRWLELRRGSI